MRNIGQCSRLIITIRRKEKKNLYDDTAKIGRRKKKKALVYLLLINVMTIDIIQDNKTTIYVYYK